ncbi:MAG: ARMT1-like domain-containing protein [Actinophytocola sp.]|uniref:damage-control phosphatase ARMT1 family protein n=1 Tax=Actinophytocola sp. TaxID=1872138 RepID=UPI003C768840
MREVVVLVGLQASGKSTFFAQRLADEGRVPGLREERAVTAAEITGNPPGSFAWGVLHDRHPKLIAQVRDGLPYPRKTGWALDELAEEITGEIRPLPGWEEHAGRSWYDVPFLWAESCFYRKLLDAVGYFAPGPWHGVDPFEPVKSAELRTPEFAEDLAAFATRTDDDALLTASLWGNRADLGFRLSAGQADGAGALLVDQSPLLWSLLANAGTVCVVADNSARELVPDLLLIDRLLATGRAARVVLHVKPYPYYVSDALLHDVVAALRKLTDGPVAVAGHRLTRAMRDGRLDVRAHPFSCAPWSYHHMPADLAEDFASATVTIMKGDLNYRRLVGDRQWAPTTPFEVTTAYFPGRVAALRTMKCDVAVGLPADMVIRLDASGEQWRSNGAHAVIHVR